MNQRSNTMQSPHSGTDRDRKPAEKGRGFGPFSDHQVEPDDDHEDTEGASLSDIYDAISNGDDEDAYLGDGIWISPGGSAYDRGR